MKLPIFLPDVKTFLILFSIFFDIFIPSLTKTIHKKMKNEKDKYGISGISSDSMEIRLTF